MIENIPVYVLHNKAYKHYNLEEYKQRYLTLS